MSSFNLTINKPEFLISGERARLIPVNSLIRKEGRITSCFLAAFMSVEEFASGLLASIGVRLGKTSKVECFTEVVFKNKDPKADKIRPDGLIVVTTGKNRWMALVEAKIMKQELNLEQIENYLGLAKEHGIDAVITLSNQFAAIPTHHPTEVKKSKLRGVSLYHWSWTYLIAEAVTWVKYRGVSDNNQSYILEELVRYLQHDSSGVLPFDRMNSTWKEVCREAQNRIALRKNSNEVLDSVGSWHQFVRSLALHLSVAIGDSVTVYLKRAHKDNAIKRLDDDAALLTDNMTLQAEFDIPGATDRLKFTVAVATRTITASMWLKAPEERSTSKGRINWILNQLKKINNDNVAVRVKWAGRRHDTMASLATIREKGLDVLLREDHSSKPVSFEVELTRDLGAKFNGPKTFIQYAEKLPRDYYEQVGQHLKRWVASPPKVKTHDTEALIEGEDDNEKKTDSGSAESLKNSSTRDDASGDNSNAPGTSDTRRSVIPSFLRRPERPNT